MDFGVMDEDMPAGHIDAQVADDKDRRFRLAVMRMAERDADSREEFAGTERFGEIVVGPFVESFDLLFFLIASRENQDWSDEPFPQASEDFESVQIGQAEIEDDEIGRLLGGKANRLLARFGFDEAIRSVFERAAQKPPQRQFVFDDQDQRRGDVH